MMQCGMQYSVEGDVEYMIRGYFKKYVYTYDICINIHSGMQNIHVTNIHTCICVSVYISICICILSF